MSDVATNPADDELFARLEETFAAVPDKPKRERAWECLAGEAPVVCDHGRKLEKTVEPGRILWRCPCGHSWTELT